MGRSIYDNKSNDYLPSRVDCHGRLHYGADRHPPVSKDHHLPLDITVSTILTPPTLPLKGKRGNTDTSPYTITQS